MLHKKKWYIWMSIWFSCISSVLACGTDESMSTKPAAAERATTAVTVDPIQQIKTASDVSTYLQALSDRKTQEAQAASRSRDRGKLPPAPTKASPKPLAASGGTATFAQLDALADCESDRNPNKNTGNGFYNAFQYVKSTWDSLVKAIGRPDLVGHYFPPYETQRTVTQHIPIRAWGGPRGQFPGCYAELHRKGIV